MHLANEQDSRFMANLPYSDTGALRPAGGHDMMEYGFRLSEENNIPVMMRLTTRMAHSRAVVEVAAKPFPQEKLTFPKDPPPDTASTTHAANIRR